MIVDSRELELDQYEWRRLHNDIWLVNGGRGRFYTSLFNDTLITGGTIFRFDPCCMRPATSRATESALLFRRAVKVARSTQIDWTSGHVLVLDNWRVLHGRGPANAAVEKQRALERVLVAADETKEIRGLGF